MTTTLRGARCRWMRWEEGRSRRRWRGAAASVGLSRLSGGYLTVATIDIGTTGTLSATADYDNNTAGSTLSVDGSAIVAGPITLSGGTDYDELINITADGRGAGALTS